MNRQVKLMLRPHFDKCELILLPERRGETATQVGIFDTELEALIRMREQWLPRLPLDSPWLASVPATVNILTNSVVYDLTQPVADMNRYFLLYPESTNIDPDAKPVTNPDLLRIEKSARQHHAQWSGKKLPSANLTKSQHWWNGLPKDDRALLQQHNVHLELYYSRCQDKP